ncbi:hypothetical protein NHX12_032758 [Muraenolepis orangiensis]|uniref:Bromodomain testis-specific protein n=1 Tax=Muraenolepis orangiensis TaxID=630683 RepID=A0A9Q0IHD9_9TELE|nr:hypothetical protein NHX12_032758 [Muraenolepis orangiensis]
MRPAEDRKVWSPAVGSRRVRDCNYMVQHVHVSRSSHGGPVGYRVVFVGYRVMLFVGYRVLLFVGYRVLLLVGYRVVLEVDGMSVVKLLPRNPPPPAVRHPRGPGRPSTELRYLEQVVLRGLYRHHFSWPFIQPVDATALNIPDYYTIISSPMDLNTIKQRLQNHFYWKTVECVQDFNTMFTNCYMYNKVLDRRVCGVPGASPRGWGPWCLTAWVGSLVPHRVGGVPGAAPRGWGPWCRTAWVGSLVPHRVGGVPDHHPGDDIVLMAQTLEKIFLERLAQMPREEEERQEEKELGSTRPPGKAKKNSGTGVLKRPLSPESEVLVQQTLTVMPRPLPSQSARKLTQNKKDVKRKADTTTSIPSTHSHPSACKSTVMPTVSTAAAPPPGGDWLSSRRVGGAKRPIKPPRKELPDCPAPGPRRAGLPEPLRRCGALLKELLSRRHTAYAWPFYSPVDVDALGLHDYRLIVTQKMEQREYGDARQFAADVRLMFSNCYKYNPPAHQVVLMARKLQLKAVRDQLQRFVQKPLKTKKKKMKKALRPRASKHKVKVHKRHEVQVSKRHDNRRHPPEEEEEEEEVAVRVGTVPYEEKKQLSLDINRLPGDRLGRLMKIIQRGEPYMQVDDRKEINVDIETLEPATLRALQAFVARCLLKQDLGTALEAQKPNPCVVRKAPMKVKPGAPRKTISGKRDLLKASIKTYRSASALRKNATQPIRTHPLQPIRSLVVCPLIPFDVPRSLSELHHVQTGAAASSVTAQGQPRHWTDGHESPGPGGQPDQEKSVPDGKMDAVKKEVVLKIVDTWAGLVKRPSGLETAAPSTRSSRESFLHFRRAALQKEEREKTLGGPYKFSGQVHLCPPETPESPFPLDAILDTPKASDSSTTESPSATQLPGPRMPLDRERETARRKEQERRRRQAMGGIDMAMQSNIMSTFEKNLDKNDDSF